jgi:hypothetical protein
MKLHRIIIYIGVLLIAALALPGSAPANSLLSGYGGPGQGNQAILGSALLNGPKGGGGGSGESGGSGSSTIASSTASGAGTASGTGTGSSSPGSTPAGASAGGSSSSSHGGAGHASGNGRHSASTAPARPVSFYPAVERIPAGAHDGTLGLSGADFLYVVLAVGVLLSLGVLTRRMGRATRQEGHGG